MINKRVNIVQENERLRPSKSEVRRLVGSNLKLKKTTGWSATNDPRSSFIYGLEKTINWIRVQKSQDINYGYTI